MNSCGIDEFDGAALDSARWTVLRPNAAGLSVQGGQLRLQALPGDLFGDRDTAQNVVLQNAPNGAWTATTQFDTTGLTVEGQQSGIVVRKSGTTFSKFVFINKGSGNTRFEHIFTENQQGRLSDADFTATLPAGFPKTVKVRVISDGETIRGEYLDGTAWKPIGRPAKIGTGVQVGVYAADNAADGPIVPYDSFALNAQNDEFAGDALEKCRWSQIVRESAAGYRVANGALEIDTGANEVNDTAPNLIGQPVPAGAWEAETKVDLTTTQQGQQAGLLLYKENTNWAKVVLVRTGATTAQIEFVRVLNNAYQLDAPFNVSVPTTTTSFYLRMRSNGTRATAEYSTNGTTWTQVGRSRDISDLSRRPPRPDGPARRRRHPGDGQVRLRPRQPVADRRVHGQRHRRDRLQPASGTASTSPTPRRPARAASTSSTTAPRAAACRARAASACCGSTPRPTTTSRCACSGSRPRPRTTPASSSASRTRAPTSSSRSTRATRSRSARASPATARTRRRARSTASTARTRATPARSASGTTTRSSS